jgi:hypothetical protein
MRALTLHPHWAHAVAHLSKTIENRGRPIPKALVGQRIAIHAGAELPKAFAPAERWRIWALREGGTTWEQDLRRHLPDLIDTEDNRWTPVRTRGEAGPDRARFGVGSCRVDGREIATRAIVATAIVRPYANDWQRFHDPEGWAESAPPEPWGDPTAAYWWALDDVRTLAEPVPVARGQLGLWRMDADTIAAVARQGG